MVFRVWPEGASPGPTTGTAWLRVSHVPWCIDGRARGSVFNMNCPPASGIPQWYCIVNGPICWWRFCVGRRWDLFLRVAWGLKLLFCGHVSEWCLEWRPCLCALQFMSCLAPVCPLTLVMILRKTEGQVHLEFLPHFMVKETEGQRWEGARPGSLSDFFFFNFYWSIVDLQCCVNFRCTAKWISYTYTSIHSFLDSFPM